MTDRELLDVILRRALDERFNVGQVTRWLELAVEVNAGNRDMFPNEIDRALGSPVRQESSGHSSDSVHERPRKEQA